MLTLFALVLTCALTVLGQAQLVNQQLADRPRRTNPNRRSSTNCGTPRPRLPIAAGLACVLALRPRRRARPTRQAAVIQTQIILAIVGAVVMLVVGASLARAFGIVGAAGLVRYRAKIDDPKDAGVMLSTLAIGLAAGVGLWMLAVFATVFILAVLWIIESFEPKATQRFMLEIKAKDPAGSSRRSRSARAASLELELRATSKEEISYEVSVPLERKTDRLSEHDSQARSRERDGGRVGGEERRRRNRADLPVVAELQRDAEVVLAQRLHGGLQLVLRRRADADLIGLNRRLHFLQLLRP